MRQLKITKKITSREIASLDNYLQDIGKIDLITAEEEVVLAQRIKQGDKEALDKLTKANLRFVVSVAKQYQNQGLTLPDLINEGNLGLIKAAQRFDETRGFKFISYAVWWIRQSILQGIAESSRIVRLPLNKVGSLNKITKETNKLEQSLSRKPSAYEISEALEVKVGEINDIQRISKKSVSLSSLLSSDSPDTVEDTIPAEQSFNTDSNLIYQSLQKEIKRVLTTLSEREAKVLVMYYGLNNNTAITLEEIGEKFNMTRERVRQIREKAIRRLKYPSRSAMLKTFLGQ